MSVYRVDGYFKDDKSYFSNYLVIDFHGVPKGYSEEDIFFFGVSDEVVGDYGDFVITESSEAD